MRLIALTIITLCITMPAKAVVVYTDRSSWEAAVGVWMTETFDNNIADANVITLDNGIISTENPFDQVNGLNRVTNGSFDGRVGNANHPQMITWDLPSLINSWFADFSAINPNGLTVTGNWDGTGNSTISIANTIGSSGGFGIVGGASFDEIIWDTNDSSEFFYVDNFSQSSVPEPSQWALLLLGLGLMGLRQRS